MTLIEVRSLVIVAAESQAPLEQKLYACQEPPTEEVFYETCSNYFTTKLQFAQFISIIM